MISNYSNFIDESINTELKAGKNVFKSFLKATTALGFKDVSRSKKIPEGYFSYYIARDINTNSVKSIFNRFRSLSMFVNSIDDANSCSIYFGIKLDMTFEYGFFTKGNIPIGHFSINRSNLNWILSLQSPSANALKKDTISLDIKRITYFCKIISVMPLFNLKASTISGPILIKDMISFGYYGTGQWNNGDLDPNEYANLKNTFKSWISRYKWSKEILVNISYQSHWVYFNIKIIS